jgi:hypothetical protein
MTDVTLHYNYKIPNEQFIDDFSENKSANFVYRGPEILVVTIPTATGNAYTQKLDGPVYDNEFTVTINTTTNPELIPYASLLWGRPYDYVAEFTQITLENGVIYEQCNNLDIHDYYFKPGYDVDSQTWLEPVLIQRDTLSPKMRTEIAKGEMFLEILSKFELSQESTAKLETYNQALSAYKSMVTTPWKYKEQNPYDLLAPKIPMELVLVLNQLKQSGLIE